MDDALAIQEIVAAIESAWETGCPVAAKTSTDQVQMARVSLRRWNSFARRHRKGGKEQQVEDLAKGLRDLYEVDRELVGPLMTDYCYLASVIAAVLLAEEYAMTDIDLGTAACHSSLALFFNRVAVFTQ